MIFAGSDQAYAMCDRCRMRAEWHGRAALVHLLRKGVVMKLKTRIWIIVGAALLGMVVMAGAGLHQLRKSMYEERHSQLNQLLDFADAQLKYFHGLEQSGKLSRAEAQARAKEAIGAQRKGDDYFFIRSLTDDILLHHPVASRVGVADAGTKLPDGRTSAQAYREELSKSKDNKALLEIYTARPNSADKKLYPKLNGVLKFEPWGWMPGVGYYVDDIDNIFWSAAKKSLFFVGMILLVFVVAATFLLRGILNLLGNEPVYAVQCMKRMAGGELNFEVENAYGGDSSMISSLKIMQMKLRNISSAIRESSEVLERSLDEHSKLMTTLTGSVDPSQLEMFDRKVEKIRHGFNMFKRSIARMKI